MSDKIITSNPYPPYSGWYAHTDEYDGAPDSDSPMGWGATEKEAIDDLMQKLEEINSKDQDTLYTCSDCGHSSLEFECPRCAARYAARHPLATQFTRQASECRELAEEIEEAQYED